jgi:cytochrome c biogenesis protein CcmG/thiol:disulfide interchange protein DsbE
MIRFLPLFALVGLIIMLLVTMLGKPASEPSSVLQGQSVPAFTLESLGVQGATINSANALKGPYIINVFASWCVPCLAEHPMLMSLKAVGIPILGINWKDDTDKAKQWLKTHGDPFALVGTDPKGTAIVTLGITGVPETFVVDANGVIVFHRKGPLTEASLNDEILPLFAGFLAEKKPTTVPEIPTESAPQATEEEPPAAVETPELEPAVEENAPPAAE